MSIAARPVAALLAVLACSSATAADLDQELAALARERDAAQYGTATDEARFKGFEAMSTHAAALAKQHPRRPEPLVFEAWALIDQSSVHKNFSSLGLLKQARQKLEAALALEPNNAAANSTLGSLYFNVPRFPLSFGDKKKGRAYSKKALAIEPTSGWMNLDYAKCLLKDEDYLGAIKHATVTLQAPMHPGSKRDTNSRAEAEAVIVQAKAKLR